MLDEAKRAEDLDPNADFLEELTVKAGFGGFARLAFSAGELPIPAQKIICPTLADKDLPLPENHGDSGVDGLHLRARKGAGVQHDTGGRNMDQIHVNFDPAPQAGSSQDGNRVKSHKLM